MKRVFFYLAAGALALTACTSEEVLDESVVQSNAIGFENVVNKQTRGEFDGKEITNDNLKHFNVFGYYTKTNAKDQELQSQAIQVFNNVQVTKDNDVWKYTDTRYWVPGAVYQFYAYSCGDSELKTGRGDFTVEFENRDDDHRVFSINNYLCDHSHQHDLLFAKSSKITGQEKGNNGTVNFQFKHLLAMVDAKFTSLLPEAYTIEISDVKIEGLINRGDYDSKSDAWSDLASVTDKDGKKPYVDLSTSDEEFKYIKAQKGATSPQTKLAFVLPYDYNGSDVKTTLSFNIKVIRGTEGNTVLDRHIVGTWTPKWELGHKYTYNINIDGDVAHLDAIEFGVTGVDNWDGETTSVKIIFKTEFNDDTTGGTETPGE